MAYLRMNRMTASMGFVNVSHPIGNCFSSVSLARCDDFAYYLSQPEPARSGCDAVNAFNNETHTRECGGMCSLFCLFSQGAI
jgi:hypothetical protein